MPGPKFSTTILYVPFLYERYTSSDSEGLIVGLLAGLILFPIVFSIEFYVLTLVSMVFAGICLPLFFPETKPHRGDIFSSEGLGLPLLLSMATVISVILSVLNRGFLGFLLPNLFALYSWSKLVQEESELK